MNKEIRINNKMQSNYEYVRTESVGENFHKDFKPQLTPKQMLDLGVFGGKYFNDVVITNEYPKSLFKNAKLSGMDNPTNKELNYFKVLAGSSLKEWKEKGWIFKEDPRGWFEWYCRYYYGRRIPDIDEKQIERWKNAERFIKSAKTYYKEKGKHSLKLLQTALQWSYDAKKVIKK